MIYADRTGGIKEETTGQDKLLAFVYRHAVTRMLIRPLLAPWVSKLGGCFLNTAFSKKTIAPFVEKNQINLSEYEEREFSSYTAFLTRKIKRANRPIDQDPEVLITPCDGRVSVYPISKNGTFSIKQTGYTAESLLCDEKLAERYMGGWIYVIRLTVSDYHRYCYVADGLKSEQRRIPGIFHTVNPVANDQYPIYKMNAREYCLLKTEELGTVLMMEVGALMVGKICNYQPDRGNVYRGEEKGAFEFGGSTIVLMTQPGKAEPDEDIRKNSEKGWETLVKMGEGIGHKIK